jgi:type I restriction-modification system DNA methylase subunit
MVSVLRGGRGIAATVMPHGVLFRGGAERAIRTRLLDDDIIEDRPQLPRGDQLTNYPAATQAAWACPRSRS